MDDIHSSAASRRGTQDNDTMVVPDCQGREEEEADWSDWLTKRGLLDQRRLEDPQRDLSPNAKNPKASVSEWRATQANFNRAGLDVSPHDNS